MKRSGPLKRTTGLKRSPMRRVAMTAERVALPAVSAKRKQLNRELAKSVAANREAIRYCQGQPLLKAALASPDLSPVDNARIVRALKACQPWNPERPHHALKRSRGSARTFVDPANILMICPSCDGFVTDEVRLATLAGLLIPSTRLPRLWGKDAAPNG